MKKIYLLAIAATVTSAAFSQVKLGGQVSANLSSASFTNDAGVSGKKSPVVGFGVGVSAELPLSGNLSVRSSLSLLQKGVVAKLSGDDGTTGNVNGKITNKMYYAELPVNLTFNKEVLGGKFFVGAGPSIGYGLFGKSKANYTVTVPGQPAHHETGSEDIFKKSDDGAGFKRFDISANVIAGMQFSSGVYVNAGYLLGLANALPKDAEGHYKNRGLQLTLGMFINGKK